MKNLVQYLKLWQKKRSELKISDDPDADWFDMQAILDTHMPVTEVPDGGSSSKPPRFKLLSMMFIALSAAAMVHFAVKFSKPKITAQHHHKHGVHKGSWSKQDSLEALTDSDSFADRPDSIDGPKQATDISNSGINKLTLDGRSLPAIDPKALPNIGSKAATDRTNDAATTTIEKGTDKAQLQNEANKYIPSVSSSVALYPVNSAKRHNLNKGNFNTAGQSANSVKKADQTFSNSAKALVNSNNLLYSSTLILEAPRQAFPLNSSLLNIIPTRSRRVIRQPLPDKSQKDNKGKSSGSSKANKNINSGSATGFDWGLLIGANSSGSFTPKNQNSNFYGRLPVDLFAGAYTTFNLSDKWSFNPQVRILSPGVLSGSYKTYTNTLKITIDSTVVPFHRDTTKITRTHITNDSKKIYSVQVPLFIAYKATDIVSFKAGPVFSFPVKQISTAQIDSANRSILAPSRFDQKVDIGLSGGVSLHYKRLIFEATYLRGLTNHKISSDSLSYQSRINPSFQFTIGIQLGKKK